MSISKFNSDEQREIIQAILKHLNTLGFAEFYIKIKQLRYRYLVSTTIIMLILILFFGAPIWSFFLPLLPICVLHLLFFIDLNFIVYGLTKAHNELIERGYKVNWKTLLEFVYELFKKDKYEKQNN